MFFKKKKDPLKTYIINDLNSGLKRMMDDGLIDINSPLAGMHVANYIAHMNKSYNKTSALLSIHYSIPHPEVLKKINESIEEFRKQWLK